MSNLVSTFSGLKVLVTGHTGFKGSWLVEWLKSMGSHVSGISLAPDDSLNLFEEAGITEGMDSRFVDIRDARLLSDTISELKPDFVFHLAAQSLVRESYVDPIGTYETNVMGTVNLLDTIRQCHSVQGVIIVTSDKCYENREWHWGYRENDPMGGHDPYSSSKGCAELVTAAYRNSFFSNNSNSLIASARAGNVIGGGDWAVDRLIPDLMRGAESGKATPIRNPQSIRPWQHVLDGLGGYLLLAKRMLNGERSCACAWNFGPADSDVMSVDQVVAKASEHWNAIKIEGPDNKNIEPHEAALLMLDSTRARRLLNWNPVFGLDEAVEKTVNWYKQYYEEKVPAKELMQSQIAEYQSRFN